MTAAGLMKSCCIVFLLFALVVSGNKGSEIKGQMLESGDRREVRNNGIRRGGGGARSSTSHRGLPEQLPQPLPLSAPEYGGGMEPQIQSYGNVTILAGQQSELKCLVNNLGNYTVTWMRHRDTHLISRGTEPYIKNTRFIPFLATGNTWGVKIKTTRISDGGIYECQISMTPPISAYVYLTVVEPVTKIEGLSPSEDIYINAGSTINLTCVVEDATDNAPKHILWKYNTKTVNFEWSRGGMSLVTEKKTKGVTVSRLLIQKAFRGDSGTYTCVPLNAHPAQAKIHVLEQGEKHAAMQSSAVLRYHFSVTFAATLTCIHSVNLLFRTSRSWHV